MINLLKKLKGSATRAGGFEFIHVPVDVTVVYLITGSIGGSVAMIVLQHTIVFCLHTLYDRFVYRNYYNGGGK